MGATGVRPYKGLVSVGLTGFWIRLTHLEAHFNHSRSYKELIISGVIYSELNNRCVQWRCKEIPWVSLMCQVSELLMKLTGALERLPGLEIIRYRRITANVFSRLYFLEIAI